MAWNRRRAAAIHQATVNLSSKKKDGQDVAAGSIHSYYRFPPFPYCVKTCEE